MRSSCTRTRKLARPPGRSSRFTGWGLTDGTTICYVYTVGVFQDLRTPLSRTDTYFAAPLAEPVPGCGSACMSPYIQLYQGELEGERLRCALQVLFSSLCTR